MPCEPKRNTCAMKLITVASSVFVIVFVLVLSGLVPTTHAQQPAEGAARAQKHLRDGRAIFRFDTLGDEQLWTKVLRMHEVIATVSPAAALSVGLKVDVDALPPTV